MDLTDIGDASAGLGWCSIVRVCYEQSMYQITLNEDHNGYPVTQLLELVTVDCELYCSGSLQLWLRNVL